MSTRTRINAAVVAPFTHYIDAYTGTECVFMDAARHRIDQSFHNVGSIHVAFKIATEGSPPLFIGVPISHDYSYKGRIFTVFPGEDAGFWGDDVQLTRFLWWLTMPSRVVAGTVPYPEGPQHVVNHVGPDGNYARPFPLEPSLDGEILHFFGYDTKLFGQNVYMKVSRSKSFVASYTSNLGNISDRLAQRAIEAGIAWDDHIVL